MKKKIFVTLVMLIFMMIIGGSSVFAKCTNCSMADHEHCTNWQYYGGNSSQHIKDCCCYSYSRYQSHSWYSNSDNTKHVCAQCGYEANHSWNLVSAECVAPTCTADGSNKYMCYTCGKSKTEAVPALGHAPGAAATCTTAQTCTRCWVTLANALGHAPGAAATCTTAQTCTRCWVTLANALGHNWVTSYAQADGIYHYTQYCTTCGGTQALAEHTYNVSSANCTTAKSCIYCEYVAQNALGHAWTTAYAAADGIYHYTQYCTSCGAWQALAGHNFNLSSANCTTAKYCTTCGYVAQSALGHTLTTLYAAYDGTYHYTQYCTTCGTWQALAEHTYNISSANCTTAKSCIYCGYVAQNALGHSAGPAATCTAPQLCTRCGIVLASALGHQYTGTCPDCGTAGIICSICGDRKSHTCYIAPPVLTVTPISTDSAGLNGWTLYGGATLSNGVITIGANGQSAKKIFQTDGTPWTLTFNMLKTNGSSSKAGAMISTTYYDANFNPVVSQNGYNGNGWAPEITSSYADYSWDGYGGYGSNVKYVEVSIYWHDSYVDCPFKISNAKFTSDINDNYTGARIVAAPGDGTLSSLKYLWSKSSSGITAGQITNTASDGQVVYPPYGSKGTYYLWVYATNSRGANTLSCYGPYIIDNPEIELSLGPTAGSARQVNAFIFNQESFGQSYYIGNVNLDGGQGTVAEIASAYYGSKAYDLVKTGAGNEWHGAEPTLTQLGNIPAGTYYVVSSNYKTTAPAGLTSLEDGTLYKNDWSDPIGNTRQIGRDVTIVADGNYHHAFYIRQTQSAITDSSAILFSGLPNWGYSTQAGRMQVDGVQAFAFQNMDEGIAVKKYAYGNQPISYFGANGTTFTGNSFLANQNGTYTVYTKTTNGVEKIRTINVTGITDGKAPEVSITNSGTVLRQDPEFANGTNGAYIYNNLANGNVTLSRVEDVSAPNSTGYALHIKTTGQAQPDHGGFTYGDMSSASKTYITKFIAKIPVGYNIYWTSNAWGDNGTVQWLTSNAGTGDWATYIVYVRTGDSGSYSSTNYFYLAGGSTATASAPVEWDVAYAQTWLADTPAWTNQNITLTGNALDTNSGTVAYAWTTTEAMPTAWTNISNSKSNVTSTYIATQNGTYYFWAKDANGNVSKVATNIERIDNTLPTASIASSVAITNGNSVRITITASDAESGIRDVIINGWYGTDWINTSTTGTLVDAGNGTFYADFTLSNVVNTSTGATNQGDGTYSFDAHVYDNAGNHMNPGRVQVIKDTVAPTLTLSADTTIVGNGITIFISDATSGIAGYAITTSGSTPTTWISAEDSQTYIPTVAGTYYVWTKDNAGNTTYKQLTVREANYTDGTTNYATLADAFNNAASGSTITVLKDVTDTAFAQLPAGKTITLDTTGHTIITTYTTNVNGTLNLNGTGTIKTDTGIMFDVTGILNINSGNIINTGKNASSYCYIVNGHENSTINVHGGNITIGEEATNGSRSMATLGDFNMDGGTITDKTPSDALAIHAWNASYNKKYTITDGSITSLNGIAIYIGGSGCNTSLDITGGTISGVRAIYIVTSGDTNITGGTLIGTYSGLTAVESAGTGALNIGTAGGAVSTTSPVIQSEHYGVKSSSGANFYDGIIKSKSGAFVGTTVTTETGYRIQNSNDGTYNIATLGIPQEGPETSITFNGTMLHDDPNFANGTNGSYIYNNLPNGNVTMTRTLNPSAPNSSGYALHIKTTGEANPNHGGFAFGDMTEANKIYVTKIIAKIPVGYQIGWHTNAFGTGGSQYWLTSPAGTGNYETYICFVRTGETGNYSSTNYFALSGGSTATASNPVEWDVAYATSYKASAMDWTNQDVTLTGNALDANSGTVAYAWTTTEDTPTDWTNITNTKTTVTSTYTATQNGMYYFWAKNANEKISKTATYVDRIDKTLPTITLSASSVSINSSVTITLSDEESDLAGYIVTQSNTTPTTWNTASASQTYTPTAVGTYYVWAKDNAGNINVQTLTATNVEANYMDSEGNGYATLAEAFTNAVSGSTISVLKNLSDTSTATLASGKTITLNINGKTLTRTKTTTNNGTLTITGGGTIKTSSAVWIITNNGDLYLPFTGTLTNTNTGNYGVVIGPGNTTKNGSGTINTAGYPGIWQDTAAPGSVITINDGTITATKYAVGVNGGTLNITGGTISGGSNYGVSNRGTGTINISGGTISSTSTFAVENHSTGTINITGGNITGKTVGAQNSSTGALNISGGNIKAAGNSTGDSIYGVYSMGGTLTISGTAVIEGANSNSGEARGVQLEGGTVAVNGGTITGKKYGLATASSGVSGLTITDGTITGTNGSGVLIGSGTSSSLKPVITGGTIIGGDNGLNVNAAVTVTVGTDDGTVSITSPEIIGDDKGYYRQNSSAKLNFYDGVFKSKVSTMSANATTVAANYERYITPTADAQGYYSAYLTKILKQISTLEATLSETTVGYDGTAKTPLVTIIDGEALTVGTDYTVVYADNVNVGTATVTITGIGDYTGTKELTFIICGAPTMPTIVITNEDRQVTSGSWSNKDLTITLDESILVGPGDIGYKYSYDNSTWNVYSGEILYTTDIKNGVIYAKAYNTSLETEESNVVLHMIKLDKTAPANSATANPIDGYTITLSISASDLTSGISEYEYYLGDTLMATSENATYTYTGLNDNTEYTLKYKVRDNAGNETGLITVTATTPITAEEIVLTSSETEWTNQSIAISITWPNTTLRKQLKINDSDWVNYSDDTYLVTSNATVYARLYDGTEGHNVKSLEISNIDKTIPSGSVVINNNDTYTDNATVTLTLTLSATDNESGITEMAISNTKTVGTFEPYASTKTWVLSDPDGDKKVYVVFKDAAGNVSSINWASE